MRSNTAGLDAKGRLFVLCAGIDGDYSSSVLTIDVRLDLAAEDGSVSFIYETDSLNGENEFERSLPGLKESFKLMVTDGQNAEAIATFVFELEP